MWPKECTKHSSHHVQWNSHCPIPSVLSLFISLPCYFHILTWEDSDTADKLNEQTRKEKKRQVHVFYWKRDKLKERQVNKAYTNVRWSERSLNVTYFRKKKKAHVYCSWLAERFTDNSKVGKLIKIVLRSLPTLQHCMYCEILLTTLCHKSYIFDLSTMDETAKVKLLVH